MGMTGVTRCTSEKVLCSLCVQNLTTAATLEISSNTLVSSLQGSFLRLEVDGDTVSIKSNTQLRSLAGLEVRPSKSFSCPVHVSYTCHLCYKMISIKSWTLPLSMAQTWNLIILCAKYTHHAYKVLLWHGCFIRTL